MRAITSSFSRQSMTLRRRRDGSEACPPYRNSRRRGGSVDVDGAGRGKIIVTMAGLFVPGWGATAALYAPGLPGGWEALELPTFRVTGGHFPVYRRWLASEI